MRFVGLKFIFITLITVSTVKSECDTYLECLSSFFDNFFSTYNTNVKTEVRNITVPGFNSANIDSADLNNLLSSVSGFIQEELDANANFSSQLNTFKNVGNSTAIYVKSITINNNFGKRIHENTSEDTAQEETIDQSVIRLDSHNTLNETKSVPITSNTTASQGVMIDHFEINEILDDNDPLGIYYDTNEDDNGTDYLKIDYLEIYKDTTNEYTDIKPTELVINSNKVNDSVKVNKNTGPDAIMFENIVNNSSISKDDMSKFQYNTKDIAEAVFPWIAAIFVKNDTSDQFEYYCDGALLSENIVITAARCMEYYGSQVNAKNLLVLLGKSSLQSMSGTERVVKVKSVIVHENFTKDATTENDIAIIFMEDTVALNDHIKTACLGGKDGVKAVTTGWDISGELKIISFDTDHGSNCKVSNEKNTFCAAYGNEVTICPSYGGVYAVKYNKEWYLRGIRSGDPSERGLCFDRSVYFTNLHKYVEWIDNNSK